MTQTSLSPTLQTSATSGQRSRRAWEMQSGAAKDTSQENLSQSFQKIQSQKGSVPCTKQLIDIYSKYKSSAISLEEVPVEKVERYRIISGSEVEKNIYKISELVEKPPKEKAPPNLAIMGRYVLTSDIFDSINETEPCISGEIQLTDAPQKLDLIQESHSRERPMTQKTGLNGSRHQTSLRWMTTNPGIIQSIT